MPKLGDRLPDGEAPARKAIVMQQISVVTLGIADFVRSRRFYEDGFGWRPVFENPEIAFFQMNGLVLGLFARAAMAEDMGTATLAKAGAGQPPWPYALAHNVESAAAVDALIARLLAHGGNLLRAADAPPHGGYRGYVADPDGHPWEIAFNPAWPISPEGFVTFAL